MVDGKPWLFSVAAAELLAVADAVTRRSNSADGNGSKEVDTDGGTIVRGVLLLVVFR